MSQTSKVFVGSLPPQCKPEELRRLFANYGIVVECDVMNRCGFVHMETQEMAQIAIAALNGIEFKGNNIIVEPGRPKDKKPGGPGIPILARGDGTVNRGRARGGVATQNHSRRLPAGQGSENFLNNRSGGVGPLANNFNGSRGASFVNNSLGLGPIRNQGTHKPQRSTPYHGPRGGSNTGNSGRSTQSYNLNSNTSGQSFLVDPHITNQGGNFDKDQNGRFGSYSSSQYQSWDNNGGNSFTITNHSQGKHNYSGGFSGNLNSLNNDFYTGRAHTRAGQQNSLRSSVSGQKDPPVNQRGQLLNQRGSLLSNRGSSHQRGGVLSHQRGPSLDQRGPIINQRGQPSNSRVPSFTKRGQLGSHRGTGNIGQDRRGFTLPVIDSQQLQFVPLNNQSRFGNGSTVNGDDDIGRFQRGSNLQSNIGSQLGNRGLLCSNRGEFVSRGGFSARHGGSNSDQGITQNYPNSRKTYQNEFPPLGDFRGGCSRNVPRNKMPNRRF